MHRVIVTVQREDGSEARDLEVPADLPIGRLAEFIARDLRWLVDWSGRPARYEIEARPLGRVLRSHETLAGAGAWDGSTLVFHPVGAARVATNGAASAHLAGWRSLGADLVPGAGAAGQADDERPAGYTWKEIDD